MLALAACISVYVPETRQTELQGIDIDDARALIKRDLLHAPGTGQAAHLQSSSHSIYWQRSITRVRFTKTELVVAASPDLEVSFPLGDLGTIRAFGDKHVFLGLGYSPDRHSYDALFPYAMDMAEVRRFADAVFALSRAAHNPGTIVDEEARFQDAVRLYGGGAKRPPLPEASIRFKVQAEGAVRDKDFEEAAELYRQGLKAAPWWAEGYFNRALVLATVEDYDTATVEMKRYLLLAPDAANARAAQDKIYDWERKAGK